MLAHLKFHRPVFSCLPVICSGISYPILFNPSHPTLSYASPPIQSIFSFSPLLFFPPFSPLPSSFYPIPSYSSHPIPPYPILSVSKVLVMTHYIYITTLYYLMDLLPESKTSNGAASWALAEKDSLYETICRPQIHWLLTMCPALFLPSEKDKEVKYTPSVWYIYTQVCVCVCVCILTINSPQTWLSFPWGGIGKKKSVSVEFAQCMD